MEYPGFSSKTMDLPQCPETMKCENVRLRSENAELWKMVDSLKLQLRCSMRDHETCTHCISPTEKTCSDRSPYTECKTYDVEEPPCYDPKYIKRCQRLAGEIALQLDRRILTHVFQGQGNLYGFSVSEIEKKILQISSCPVTKRVNEKLRRELNQRYSELMCKLRKLHYNPAIHPYLSEHLINTFGIIKERPAPDSREYAQYCDPKMLHTMISVAATSDTLKDVHILLACLIYMAEEDGRPILDW